MKISDTTLLCALALKSLDESIAPELQSPAALSAVGFIRDALRAVVHRGTDGVSVLPEINRDGAEIAAQLGAALARHGIAVPAGEVPPTGHLPGLEDLTRVQGELTAPPFPESLALEFAELLAKLHQMPLESFREVIEQYDDPIVFTETIEQNYRRHLISWRHYVETSETQPSPLMAYLFDWLENNIPADPGRPVLVHGDYSIHNVLADDGKIKAVLDWEAAMFGAPGIDIAYVQLALARHIDWPKFLAHYEACGGRAVDSATLNYHLAFQAMKIMVAMIRAHAMTLSGKLDDIRMTAFELGFLPQFIQMSMASTADR